MNNVEEEQFLPMAPLFLAPPLGRCHRRLDEWFVALFYFGSRWGCSTCAADR
jgi:hypothetical protein